MSLINCEMNLILTWSRNCVIIYTSAANRNATFKITETKLYVPVVTFQLKIMQNYYHNQNQILK